MSFSGGDHTLLDSISSDMATEAASPSPTPTMTVAGPNVAAPATEYLIDNLNEAPPTAEATAEVTPEVTETGELPQYAQDPLIPAVEVPDIEDPPGITPVDGFGEVDFTLLNPHVQARREAELRAAYMPAFAQAQTQVERNLVEERFKLELVYQRMEVKHVQMAREQQEMARLQAYLLNAAMPHLRVNSAAALAHEFGMSVEEVSTDRRGRIIKDPAVMRLLAEERAQSRQQQAVQQRAASRVDSPINTAQGGGGSVNVWGLSPKDFEAHKRNVRRMYGGR